MNNSETSAKPSAAQKNKPRSSAFMKSFWGLIGLLALAAAGLIGMAVVALNEHTYVEKSVEKPAEPGVEILDLAGNSRMVDSSLVPANPLGSDENVVKSDTEGEAQAKLDDEKAVGTKLVEAVKPVVVEKKTELTAKPSEHHIAKAEPVKPPKVEKSVQHKEANAQMDNLF